MVAYINKKLFTVLGIVFLSVSVLGCGQSKTLSHDLKLPEGAVGAVSFQGNDVKIFDKNGRELKPQKIDLKKATKLGDSITFTRYKLNPCVIERCTSTGCKTYVYEQLTSCPAWW